MASTLPEVQRYVVKGQTVGAVALTLLNVPTITNSVICARAVILGQRQSNGNAYAVHTTGIFNNDSGVLTSINILNQVGPGGQIFTDGGNGILNAITPDIEVQVLGVATATIDWTAFVELVFNNT